MYRFVDKQIKVRNQINWSAKPSWDQHGAILDGSGRSSSAGGGKGNNNRTGRHCTGFANTHGNVSNKSQQQGRHVQWYKGTIGARYSPSATGRTVKKEKKSAEKETDRSLDVDKRNDVEKAIDVGPVEEEEEEEEVMWTRQEGQKKKKKTWSVYFLI